jgi:hypothetical protein
MDGDGSLLVSKYNILTAEITVYERDVEVLHNIKEIYGGSVL